MPKTKISEYSATANSNTDVASINIDEGCAPSGINNAIRAVMGHLKDFQQGTNGDPFNGPVNGTLGATTASTANVTTLTTSSTVTHNGGTANGVAYLNTSKQVTTGSALVFDGSNLGLGVTPKPTWSTSYKALQVGSQGAFWANASGSDIYLSSNFYFDGSQRYIGNGYASFYSQNNGLHNWQIAPSNSSGAGQVAVFTQAMTLDASGNLGVGTTSPTSRLHVSHSSASTNAIAQFTNGTTGTGAGNGLYVGIDSTNTATIFNFYNSALQFGTNGTTKVVLDTSGNFQVGFTGSQNAKTNIVQSANYPVLAINNTNASFTDGAVIIYTTRNTTNSSYNQFACYNGDFTGQFIIRDSGNAVNTNNSYAGISDVKLKENVTDATPKLENLNQVRVVSYNFIGSEQKQIGVIAQELEQIFPGMVEEAIDRDKEGNDLGTTTKSVKYSVFVPMLIKAIQELKAEFDAYKASHP